MTTRELQPVSDLNRRDFLNLPGGGVLVRHTPVHSFAQ